MTQRVMHPHEIQCAKRFNGQKYKKKYSAFNFTVALEKYWETQNWNHLSMVEAMATMFLLHQALEAWQRSKSASDHFDRHYQAFHSLYELLKDVQVPSWY
jgi:hypothetical protein